MGEERRGEDTKWRGISTKDGHSCKYRHASVKPCNNLKRIELYYVSWYRVDSKTKSPTWGIYFSVSPFWRRKDVDEVRTTRGSSAAVSFLLKTTPDCEGEGVSLLLLLGRQNCVLNTVDRKISLPVRGIRLPRFSKVVEKEGVSDKE